MKKTIVSILAVFTLCTAFNTATTDYRDAYCGTYFCKSTTSTINLEHGGTSTINKDTTSIQVIKDVIDSVLLVKIARSTHKFKLINNILSAYPAGGHFGGRFIATDSIFINIAIGHAGTTVYKGKKK